MRTKRIKYFLVVAILIMCFNPAYALDETVDRELRSIWHSMKNALVNNNLEKAIEYYHSQTKQNYRGLYVALGDKLPQIAREMGDIQPIVIKENEAKYRLLKKETRGGKTEDITYPVYFLKDNDGKWKILRY